ncbi:putative holin-like toxin [Virgibacillus sp. MSJ-26]|nr:putative holin-like toxin [Virgibacillus sp. MSJ-26]MBU5466196.1 putative holin-like toxin [Virgibacillus sp. MSJ-26]
MTDFQIALSTGIFILAFINLVIVLIEKISKK